MQRVQVIAVGGVVQVPHPSISLFLVAASLFCFYYSATFAELTCLPGLKILVFWVFVFVFVVFPYGLV